MSHHGDHGDIPEWAKEKLGLNQSNDELKEELKKFHDQLGGIDRNLQDKIQNRWPDGILRADDDGQTMVAIGVESGKVVLQFTEPTKWVGFTPDQAMEIAETLIKHARKAGLTRSFALTL